MHVKPQRRLVKDERGVALTEFALVLPLFMLLLIGILEFGKVINFWLDMTHVANEGARMAVVNRYPGCTSGGAPCTPTLQRYLAGQGNTVQLVAGDPAGSTDGVLPNDRLCVEISFPSGTAHAGDPVTVTARTKYNLLFFLGEKLNVPALTIKASATMRLEQDPTRFAAGASYASGSSPSGSPPTCPS